VAQFKQGGKLMGATGAFMGDVLGIGKTVAELIALINKSGKSKPDAVAMLTLISQLQQQIDQLKSERDEAKRKYAEVDAWNARKADIELVITAGGARVHRSTATPDIYYCSICLEKHLLLPLQPSSGGQQNCRECKAYFQIDAKVPSSMPNPPENPWNRRWRTPR
jgi:hypothetical protein